MSSYTESDVFDPRPHPISVPGVLSDPNGDSGAPTCESVSDSNVPVVALSAHSL